MGSKEKIEEGLKYINLYIDQFVQQVLKQEWYKTMMEVYGNLIK